MIPKYHTITINRVTYIVLGLEENADGYFHRMLALKNNLFGRAFAQIIKLVDRYSERIFKAESDFRGFKEGDLFPKLSVSYAVMWPYRLLNRFGHRIDGQTNPDGVIDVEHIHTPRHMIAGAAQFSFPRGACVIFADQELLAAIPASFVETKKLDELLTNQVAYLAYRDKLCGETGHEELTRIFREAMEKEQYIEEVKEQAARN